MKIRIDEKDYIGTPVEILDQLRQEADQGLSTVGDPPLPKCQGGRSMCPGKL